MLYYKEKCINCGLCVQVCPVHANVMEENIHKYKRELCITCGACQEICPGGAFEIAGYEMEEEVLLKKISRDKIFYQQTQGGVTFSGGEPLMQAKVLQSILRRCKQQKIHTAIETCLIASEKVIEELIPYIDIWICDMKAYDSDLHEKYTGAENVLILRNLKNLAKRIPEKMWVRIPLIPGVSAEEEQFRRMASFLSQYNFERVEIMPYHDVGVSKYAALGQSYGFKNEKIFTLEEVQRYKKILIEYKVSNVV